MAGVGAKPLPSQVSERHKRCVDSRVWAPPLPSQVSATSRCRDTSPLFPLGTGTSYLERAFLSFLAVLKTVSSSAVGGTPFTSLAVELLDCVIFEVFASTTYSFGVEERWQWPFLLAVLSVAQRVPLRAVGLTAFGRWSPQTVSDHRVLLKRTFDP